MQNVIAAAAGLLVIIAGVGVWRVAAGPFLWGQLAPLVAASIGESGWVRWSPLGLTLALVLGLTTLPGDRVGARPLIVIVCTATLGGALLLTALSAFSAQAVVFGGVQGLPTLLHHDHVSTTTIGYVQGSAIAAALLVARPRKLAHTTFGRLVPVVALITAGIAAPSTHDHVRQALWLPGANMGAIVAEWISGLAAGSTTHWLVVITLAAALFLATSLIWYETHHRIHQDRGKPDQDRGGKHRARRGGQHRRGRGGKRRAHPHSRARSRP